MATIKISVSDDTPLGRHVLGLKSRERSRELYMLASLGMTQLELSSGEKRASKVMTTPKEKIDVVQNSPVVAFQNPERKNSVNFGAELLDL